MGDVTCVIEGCPKPVMARRYGWCSMHHARWRRHGDPLFTKRPTMAARVKGASIEERFWVKVDAEGDCWEWTAYRNPDGYGYFGITSRDVRMAHRWSWEHLVGLIPAGMQIDHMCRNRGCVNPDHLRVVTLVDNVLLGEGPPARNARKTHCPEGHAYAGDNVRVYARPSGTPSRYCRACHNNRIKSAKGLDRVA